jgi:hypothetical protein
MWIVALEEPEGRLVMAYEPHHLLAHRKRHAEAPENAACGDGSSHRVRLLRAMNGPHRHIPAKKSQIPCLMKPGSG